MKGSNIIAKAGAWLSGDLGGSPAMPNEEEFERRCENRIKSLIARQSRDDPRPKLGGFIKLGVFP
jgi:hypothetical protein